MTMPMNVARTQLTKAIEDLDRFGAMLKAAGGGPLRDAKNRASSVFRGGYELRKVNEVLGRLERLSNELHSLIGDAASISGTINDVKGR